MLTWFAFYPSYLPKYKHQTSNAAGKSCGWYDDSRRTACIPSASATTSQRTSSVCSHQRLRSIHIYIYMYIYIYIYTYMGPCLSMVNTFRKLVRLCGPQQCIYICTYIYIITIYMYMHIYNFMKFDSKLF